MLWVIEQAETQSQVARAAVRADGWLLGLLDALVITEAQRETLYQALVAVETGAAVRAARRDSQTSPQ